MRLTSFIDAIQSASLLSLWEMLSSVRAPRSHFLVFNCAQDCLVQPVTMSPFCHVLMIISDLPVPGPPVASIPPLLLLLLSFSSSTSVHFKGCHLYSMSCTGVGVP